MSNIKVNQSQKIALAIATGLALILGVIFLKQYLMLIILSAIVVVLFNPIYHWLLKKGRGPGQSATITFLASLLVVVIPIILVSMLTLFQIDRLVTNISSGNYSFDSSSTSKVIDEVNQFFKEKGANFEISKESIANSISQAVQEFGKMFLEGLISSISGFFALITTSIIYLYVFFSMIIHQKKITDLIKKLNPLGEKISDLYIERISAMTKAAVRGQFIIAVCQGLASAIILSIAGLSNLFFFFIMLLTVLSVVPLGAGLITITIGIAMILTGNIWQGVLVIANHLIIVTNIDNVLRPKLVPGKARLDPALMILAVFAGIGLFGFMGIVMGPVIMIVLVTTIQIYLEVFKDTRALNTKESVQSKTGRFIAKITNLAKLKKS